jgi:arylsulfatase
MGAGYDRGFDDYFDAIGAKKDPHRGSTANDVAQTGLSWINKLDGEQPWFLVLHFFDPHASFEDHPQVDWLDPNYSGWVTGGISTDELRKREKDCTPEDIRALGSFYDEEILAVDNGIKLFVEGLDSSQWQQTVMLLTSDHGEELGERQHIGHTQTLMTELVDVPLMVRVPPQFSKSWQLPESKNGGYAMTQIYPALLNVSGIEVPPSRSLFAPDVLKSQVDFAPVRVEHVEKYVQKVAIRKGDLHMIADQRQGTVAMFDLSADPQMQNLLPSSHPQFSSMVDLLQAQKWWLAK